MAKQSGFKWKIGGQPPGLESHSNAKLLLLAEYLDRYFNTVVKNPRMDTISITFVDGFSGGGMYQRFGAERQGSPFVILDAVRDAHKRLNEGRNKPIAIAAKFYFVDSDRNAILYLKDQIQKSEYACLLTSGQIVIIREEFEVVFPSIIEEIKHRHRGGRSVFVLDQKGWNAVQFSTIKVVLSELPRSEVLLTFSVDWMMTYMNNADTFAKAMSRIGIEGSRLKAYIKQRGVQGYQYVIPRLLLKDIRELTGAAFFSPFFLRSQRANRDLWIIHLSKLVTARNVMIESHWQIGNSSLYRGAAGLDMLGFDPHWEEGTALDFGFDQTAEAAMSQAMLNEMPYKIEQIEKHGVPTVARLFEAIANDTAASKLQIETALRMLHAEKQIDLLNAAGNVKRRDASVQLADGVQLTRSKLLPGISWQ